MTLVSRHVRSSTDPGRVAVAVRGVDRTAVVGEHDLFLPSRALVPAVRRTLGVELGVIASAGHLVIDECADRLVELVTG